jgi:hypothetical protein
MYSSTHSLTSALVGGEWSASCSGLFTPRERAPGTHWIGGWVGPRAVLDAVVKRKIPSPRRESNPRTTIIQPVVQRYTDWAITALVMSFIHIQNENIPLGNAISLKKFQNIVGEDFYPCSLPLATSKPLRRADHCHSPCIAVRLISSLLVILLQEIQT